MALRIYPSGGRRSTSLSHFIDDITVENDLLHGGYLQSWPTRELSMQFSTRIGHRVYDCFAFLAVPSSDYDRTGTSVVQWEFMAVADIKFTVIIIFYN